MNKVYLDLGANDGGSIRQFRRSQPPFKSRMGTRDYRVIAVEPLASRFLLAQRFPSVTVIESAAWVFDGTVPFIEDTSQRGFSSCVPRCAVDTETVPCVDTARLIRELKASYLVVKMDIEGAEYVVLPWLLECQVLPLVNELYIEFHNEGEPDYAAAKRGLLTRITEQARECYLCEQW